MREKKMTVRLLFVPGVSIVFILSLVVAAIADDKLRNNLYLLVGVGREGVRLQSAELLGGLNTEGWIHTDKGVVSLTPEKEAIPILKAASDSSLCVGNCTKDTSGNQSNSLTQQEDLTYKQQASSSLASSSLVISEQVAINKEENISAPENEPSIVVVSSSTEAEQEEYEEEGQELEEYIRSRNYSSGKGDKSIEDESATSTENEHSEEASSSTSQKIIVTEKVSQEEYPAENQETFLAALFQLLDLRDGYIGIGMDALEGFALSIRGLIFTTKGIVVGDAPTQIGLGITDQGICLGSCEFLPDRDSSIYQEQEQEQEITLSPLTTKNNENSRKEDVSNSTTTPKAEFSSSSEIENATSTASTTPSASSSEMIVIPNEQQMNTSTTENTGTSTELNSVSSSIEEKSEIYFETPEAKVEGVTQPILDEGSAENNKNDEDNASSSVNTYETSI